MAADFVFSRPLATPLAGTRFPRLLAAVGVRARFSAGAQGLLFTKLGNDEPHTLGHKPADESHITREAVELGHDHRTAPASGFLQRCGKLLPAVERISTLAGSASARRAVANGMRAH